MGSVATAPRIRWGRRWDGAGPIALRRENGLGEAENLVSDEP